MRYEPGLLPDKDPAEKLDVEFDFADEIAPGETISSAVQSVPVRTGTDASPSALLDGAASIVGLGVIQRVKAGVSGVAYVLRSEVTLSSGRVLVLAGILPVRTLA